MYKLFRWIFNLGYDAALADIRKHGGIHIDGDYFCVNPQRKDLDLKIKEKI